MKIFRVLVVSFLCTTLGQGSRFRVQGPVVTLTLKDPVTDAASRSSKWVNLKHFRPNLLWSFQSISRPLPAWLPNLQSLQGTVGYHYEEMRRTPSFVEGTCKFRARGVDLDIQPSYEFKGKRGGLLVQVSKGATYCMAKFGNAALELIKGCYQMDLPYASVGSVRITPTWDVQRGEPSCILEGTTGSQRTKAILNLEYQNPTMTVVHALDDRCVNFNPTIMLGGGPYTTILQESLTKNSNLALFSLFDLRNDD